METTILGFYTGYTRMMEKKLEITMQGLGFRDIVPLK